TLHVIRELGARGPMTSTLMAVVAATDAIAIMIFGIAVSTAHNLISTDGLSLAALLFCLYEIGASLLVGLLTGLFIDKVLDKLHNNGEMLTAGLALLLLCGELTSLLHLSPLLAGMMVGFVIINRTERDVRLFRIINGFEPPIYVLFFTLAGVHLELSALKLAGWVGMAYFFARIIGKYCGSWIGFIAFRQKYIPAFLLAQFFFLFFFMHPHSQGQGIEMVGQNSCHPGQRPGSGEMKGAHHNHAHRCGRRLHLAQGPRFQGRTVLLRNL
ncbi:MAG: hypothetical protein D3904_17365, partial [Candidatus Electrothrix sp. EH2]|nr:hypothetical protein [Candidatus Electrothrix sp. EH2]